MLTDDLNCDIDEWIREAETSTRDFRDKKQKLAPFKNAGWWDNGSTYLSYYKRFHNKNRNGVLYRSQPLSRRTLDLVPRRRSSKSRDARSSFGGCRANHPFRESLGGKGDLE